MKSTNSDKETLASPSVSILLIMANASCSERSINLLRKKALRLATSIYPSLNRSMVRNAT